MDLKKALDDVDDALKMMKCAMPCVHVSGYGTSTGYFYHHLEFIEIKMTTIWCVISHAVCACQWVGTSLKSEPGLVSL